MPWITAARVFDGEEMVEHPMLLMENGAIVDVGVTPPESAEVLDLGDATVLPGLVDCHQHLCFDGQGTLEEQVTGIDDDALLGRARNAAKQALSAGITTLRDLGDRDYVTLDLRNDATLPTILASGPPITRLQGHCWYLGGEVDVHAEGTLRAAVEERAQYSCDVVKIMVSGGVLTPTFPPWVSQFSPQEVALVTEVAHALGLPVAAHCHGIDAIVSSIEAGVDSIEHCTFVDPSGSSAPTDELLARLADSGIPVSATVGRLPGEMPPIVAANYGTFSAAWLKLRELGGHIVAGTDAGISAVKPHSILPYAYAEFVDIGWTPIEAMRAITSLAASSIGLAQSKGRIAPGLDADLLVVAGNPFESPRPLTDVVAVWCRGERVR